MRLLYSSYPYRFDNVVFVNKSSVVTEVRFIFVFRQKVLGFVYTL